MLPYPWPCHVSRDGDGRFRVTPFDMHECDGTGYTLELAADAARKALQSQLDFDPDIFLFGPRPYNKRHARGHEDVIRVHVKVPSAR